MIHGNYITVDGERVEFEARRDAARRDEPRAPPRADALSRPAPRPRRRVPHLPGRSRGLAPPRPPPARPPAQVGMVVLTQSERAHRANTARRCSRSTSRTNPNTTRTRRAHACEVHAMANEFDAPTDWMKLESETREARDDDRNPYIQFRADKCILCARCTRYCDEVEQVVRDHPREARLGDDHLDRGSPLALRHDLRAVRRLRRRLPDRRDDREDAADARREARPPAREGAHDLQLLRRRLPDGPERRQARADRVVKVTSPPAGTLPNDGNLCVKGRFAYDFIESPRPPDRAAGARGRRRAARSQSWEEALQRAAEGLRGVAERARQGLARLRLLLALHRRGELPRAEARARACPRHEQRPPVRRDMTRSHGGRSGHHLRRGSDDELDPGDPRRGLPVRDRLEHLRSAPDHRDGDEAGRRAAARRLVVADPRSIWMTASPTVT